MSRPNHNPNWKAEQRALAEKTRTVRIHPADATVLRFSDRVLHRLPSGQLIRVNPAQP